MISDVSPRPTVHSHLHGEPIPAALVSSVALLGEEEQVSALTQAPPSERKCRLPEQMVESVPRPKRLRVTAGPLGIRAGPALHRGTSGHSVSERGVSTCPRSTRIVCLWSLHYETSPAHIRSLHPSYLCYCLPLNIPGRKKWQCQQNPLVSMNSILNEATPTHGSISESEDGSKETPFPIRL